MSILERRNRNCAETSYFLKFAKDITSQNGEDGIIERIFQLVGTSPNPFCVDVGAWDGVHLSNTFNLLKNKKWGGILFEADDHRCNGLKQLYRNRDDVICVNSLVQISGEQALGGLLSKYSIALDIDFITIDVDGADYHLWKGIGSEYKPRVVCIEFNPTIPNNVYFIQEADTRIQQGSSLLAINELGGQLGYTLVATTIFNAIFVRNDLMHLIPDYPRDLDSLHAPEMCTEMFQTYDGEIKFVGPKKLLWHKLAINPQKMQVLNKKDRKFPFAPTWDTKIRDLEGRLYAVTQEVQSLVSLKEENDVEQLICFLQLKVVSIHSLFTQYLAAASELVVFQFLEAIVLNTMSHFLHQLDATISDVCFTTETAEPQSPDLTDAHTPLSIRRSVLVPFTFSLHLQVSCFHELRAEQVRSGSVSDAVEWLKRALYTMEPNFHHSLIAASNSSSGGSAGGVPLLEVPISGGGDLSELVLPTDAASTVAPHLPFSCYDFLVQYTDVTDSVRTILALTSTIAVATASVPRDLSESTASNVSTSSTTIEVFLNVYDLQLRDVNLRLQLAKLSLTQEAYYECSHYLSSGMAQLCELSSHSSSGASVSSGRSPRISRTGSCSSSKSSSGINLNASTFTSGGGGGSALGTPAEPTEAQSQLIADLIQSYWKQHQKYLHRMKDLSETEEKRLSTLFGSRNSVATPVDDVSQAPVDAPVRETTPVVHREVFKEAEAKRVNKKLPKPEKMKASSAADVEVSKQQSDFNLLEEIEYLKRSNADLESQLDDMTTFSMALVGGALAAFVCGYLLGGGVGGGRSSDGV